jgi:hypothetical protein
MSHGVEQASNGVLSLLKRQSCDPKCTLNNFSSNDTTLIKNVDADKVLDEGDEGELLAKEKDILYAAELENETFCDWLDKPRRAKSYPRSSDFAEASFCYLMLHFHCLSCFIDRKKFNFSITSASIL